MSRARHRWLGVLVSLPWLAANLACDPAEVVGPPDAGIPAGGGLPYDAGNGDADADAAGGGGPVPDAGHSAVRLGLVPNPHGTGGGTPTATEELEARLATYAVGVRSVVISRTWSELHGQPVDELITEINEYRAAELAVVFNLLVVDRGLDHRPAELSGLGWDAPQAVSALQTTLDELLGPLDEDLHALVLGREADAYLEAHPAEATSFSALLTAGIEHADGNSGSQPPTAVGLSYVGDSPSASYMKLLELGQLAAWTYQPGLGAAQLPTDTSPAMALDTMIGLADARPIIVLATGLTSNPALGGSDDGQQLFFDSLFGALASRRAHFDVVHVHELHDRAAARCEALAASRGETADGPFADFACQSGLKQPDGTAKPAWTSFVQGAAAFASP